MLRKTDGGRRRRQQRMRWLVGITSTMDMSLSKLQEFTQIHVREVNDAIQPSHPLSSPYPPPSIRVFSKESTLCMKWPKYWSFSFSIIPSKEIPGLISFRMDWLYKPLILIHQKADRRNKNYNPISL